MEQAENSGHGDSDRLSSLPDCLIHLIMSFLTAQEAVQTCILSKRWNNLWTTSPFLDFDLCKFMCVGKPDDTEWDNTELEDARKITFDKFRDSVSITILLRETSDLHKFRLSCKMNDWLDHHMLIRSWILYALKHNPKVFDINVLPMDSLPHGAFTCKSLVEASLSAYTSVQTVEVINLPLLKRLHLNGVVLNQGYIDKLFSGCPVLEFLYLEGFCEEASTIKCQSLKYLKIQCYCLSGDVEKRIKLIDTPNLLSFCYRTCWNGIGHEMLLKMPSLTHASIYSQRPYKGRSNIVLGLSNIQSLKLSGRAIKDLLQNELPNCPDFSNVKELSLNYLYLCYYFNLFANVLDHFPNLEKLSIQLVGCNIEGELHGKQEPLEIEPFKGTRLQTVEVKFHRSNVCFPWVMKFLQDFTGRSRPQINITGLDNWSSQEWDFEISEQVWQHW
ncbi:hypothetical protein LUZ63_015748 [Rhynchospora breviuscula]|uniref:F-box domain-containing protein n=1 Tax=Rhynchospora breviuscula TaxID=2022672 RepID=A0A9Q0CCX6_9POAL|nr:hypothetical protein LUZ63_015748 [Rhynchospora breviuscula]